MRLFLLIGVVVFVSCSENKVEKKDSLATKVSLAIPAKKAGNIFSFQPCQLDANLHYSVYYPTRFQSKEKFPLLILFDPHGDPDYALEKYKPLADEYDFILLASKESKNGNSAEQTANIVQTILYQTILIEKVDTNQIFTGGFSGGARVASMLALSASGVKGLVVCGAGIPSGSWTGVPPHVVIGIAGNSDMNLTEIINFKTQDPRMMSRYHAVRYSGNHAWPPLSVMENAFIAFSAIAQRDRFTPVSIPQLEAGLAHLKQQSDSVSNTIEKVELHKSMIKNFQGMMDTRKVEAELQYLMNSIEYKQALSVENEFKQIESKNRNFFLSALGVKDTLWWRTEFQRWESNKGAKSPLAFEEMKSRVRGMISLSTYMSLNRAVAASHTEQCAYFSSIYRLVDPQNTEAWYLSAVSAVMDGDFENALRCLDEAIRLGFKDADRCKMEPAFAAIQNDSRFQLKVNQIIN
jgi:pimeloyl-ACP methyl ester carboxylesterase